MTFAQSINGGLRRVPTWPLYIVSIFPPVWFLYLGLTGGLGAEPIEALEHKLGELALQLFVVVLAITPLRDWVGINLVKFRRAIGLIVFFYLVLHLLVWLVLDVGDLGAIWKDIVKRPYITVGMVGFALLIPLAVTSNNWSIRRMGPLAWRRFHKLTYAAGVLGAVHFVMLAKGFQIEPLIYLGVILLLLAARIKLPKRTAPAAS
ncbi:MAG: protein-methionine-sulfoxide reductase heme-binding subunit MsrQ [Pseudomonadota bacterium]